MTCGVENNSNLSEEFPAYFNFDELKKEKQIIFESNLKGKKLSESYKIKTLNNIDINITILPIGIYKIAFDIQNIQETRRFTDISKGVLINDEIKDIYFHKVDVISVNGKTTITTIFEILTNPIPLLYVIYAIGAMGVSITGSILLKNVSKVTQSISSNIIKIGASLIVIILGIKVMSKW